MNVILVAIGSHGDVHPYVGLGREMRRRGHRVTVAANEYFKSLVEGAGLEFTQVGTAEQYRNLASDPDMWHRFRSVKTVFAKAVIKILRETYQVVADHHVPGETVVVASSLAMGARVAQETLGVPLATVHLQPSIFRSLIEPPPTSGIPVGAPMWAKKLMYGVADAILDSMVGKPVNALRAEFGLKPVKAIMKNWWDSPLRVIGMFPAWFAPPQPDWPPQARLTGFPLYDEPEVTPMSDALRAFLDAGDAPIAFTPGSAMWRGRRFFEASARACEMLGRRGLLLTRHRDHLPSRLPRGVIHVDYAPFSELLPRVAALVHHGGIGTSAQAMAAGCPQLIMPFTHDQPDNAARLKRLGVAAVVPLEKYTPDRVAPELRRLIESRSAARACQVVRSRFVGVDAIGDTCDLLEALLPNISTQKDACKSLSVNT